MKNINLWIYLIILFAVVLRIYLFLPIDNESGGDSFEFLLIARRLIEFEEPFVGVKRLPVYPLLLLPSYIMQIDGLFWGRLVNSLLAGLSVYVVYLINKKLKVPDFLNLFIALLFTTSQVYLFFSLRPLSYVLYTLLFVTSIYFALDKRLVATSLSLGLLSMTRHEGFLVALFIFVYQIVVTDRKRWVSKLLLPGLIYLLIVSPFFISNYINHNNFLYLGYLDDGGGLYPPSNLDEFRINLSKISNAVYTAWGNPAIINRGIKYIRWVFVFSSAMMVLGAFTFFKKASKEKLMILTLIVSQFLVALWLQPSGRYIQHLIPFFALFLILGVSRLDKFYIMSTALTLLLVITSLFTVYKKISEFRYDTISQRDFTQIVRSLKMNQDATVSMERDPDYTHSYIALYYLGRERVKFVEDINKAGGTDYLLDWRTKPYVKKIN